MDDLKHQKALLGDPAGIFWLYDSEKGFDLTHPTTPTTATTKHAITLTTSTSNIAIDPEKTALVIVDMQNFFLSTALGRPLGSKGLEAQSQLLKHALPAARKAKMQVVWLNWGLTEEDLKVLPPAEQRAFGFNTLAAAEFDKQLSSLPTGNSQTLQGSLASHDLGKDPRMYKGLGRPLGSIRLDDGTSVDAGRMLMRHQWNTDLSGPLQQEYENSLNSSKPDAWIHKSRISGMHLPDTPAGMYFREQGLQTLIFAGVNTDQCVNATLTDAYCQSFDALMLKDACATTSPGGAQECTENNVSRMFGFLLDCETFAKDIDICLARR